MSEAATLTRRERKVALDAIFSLVDGRVPVAVGYSGPTTSVVIRRMKAAPQLGARAATISAPMLTTDLEEILAAVRAIDEDRRKAAAELFDHYLPLILSEGQPKIGLGIRKEILKRVVAHCPQI